MKKEEKPNFLLKLFENADFLLLKEQDKFEALEEMVDLLPLRIPLKNRSSFLQKIIEREQIISTGIGNGVAIPHAHGAEIKDYFIALGYHPLGIDFESVDKKPVHLLILMGTPGEDPNRKTYLKTVSALSKRVKNIDNIIDINCKEKFLKIFFHLF